MTLKRVMVTISIRVGSKMSEKKYSGDGQLPINKQLTKEVNSLEKGNKVINEEQQN